MEDDGDGQEAKTSDVGHDAEKGDLTRSIERIEAMVLE
jgi:hypothetical protein